MGFRSLSQEGGVEAAMWGQRGPWMLSGSDTAAVRLGDQRDVGVEEKELGPRPLPRLGPGSETGLDMTL